MASHIWMGHVRRTNTCVTHKQMRDAQTHMRFVWATCLYGYCISRMAFHLRIALHHMWDAQTHARRANTYAFHMGETTPHQRHNLCIALHLTDVLHSVLLIHYTPSALHSICSVTYALHSICTPHQGYDWCIALHLTYALHSVCTQHQRREWCIALHLTYALRSICIALRLSIARHLHSDLALHSICIPPQGYDWCIAQCRRTPHSDRRPPECFMCQNADYGVATVNTLD